MTLSQGPWPWPRSPRDRNSRRGTRYFDSSSIDEASPYRLKRIDSWVGEIPRDPLLNDGIECRESEREVSVCTGEGCVLHTFQREGGTFAVLRVVRARLIEKMKFAPSSLH